MHSTAKADRPSLLRPERWVVTQDEDGTFTAAHLDSAARFEAIKLNTSGSLLVRTDERGAENLVDYHGRACECGRPACIHLCIAEACAAFCARRAQDRLEADREAGYMAQVERNRKALVAVMEIAREARFRSI